MNKQLSSRRRTVPAKHPPGSNRHSRLRFAARRLPLILFAIGVVTLATAVEPPVKLNGPLGSYGDVRFLKIGPDGFTVVYLADQMFDDVWELYSVPIDGSAPPVWLSWQILPGTQIGNPEFSPDGSRVAYKADELGNGVWELYSVPIEGGTPVKLNSPLVTGGGCRAFRD